MSCRIIHETSTFTEGALAEQLFKLDATDVPCGFLPVKGDGEEVLEILFSKNPAHLRMYGSSEELTTPIVYKSLRNEAFIHKSDVFPLLFEAFRTTCNSTFHHLVWSMLSVMLKSREERLDATCEFVKYDESLFKKFQTEYQEIKDGLRFEMMMMPDKIVIKPKNYKFEKIFSRFKALTLKWRDDSFQDIKEILMGYFQRSEPGNRERLSVIIVGLEYLAEYLNDITKAHPEMFLPYDKVTNAHSPIGVRIFVDHNERFVMKSELFKAINLVNPKKKSIKYEEEDLILCMKHSEVVEEYKDLLGKIEFIQIEIPRTKHAAVPILTPPLSYCIPAVDALFEIFNRLIFGHQIFQKFTNDSWPVLAAALANLTPFFTPYHVSFLWFFKFQILFKNLKIDFLQILRKKPKKRYNYFLRRKTIESIDEKLENFCEKFSKIQLQLFLHTQNACHRLPNLHCDQCSLSPSTAKFKNSKWIDFRHDEVDCSFGKHLTLPNGSVLLMNYVLLNAEDVKQKNEFKFFILDDDDGAEVTKRLDYLSFKSKEGTKDKENLRSLEAFQRFYPQKKIYIRAIQSAVLRRYERRRVFTDEVLDVIAVVLRQQNTPIQEDDDEVLQIVPDQFHELGMIEMVENLGNELLEVINPTGSMMIRTQQAVFHVFQSILCNVNWTKKDNCKKHRNCLESLRSAIVALMKDYAAALEEGSYVWIIHADTHLEQLKNHCHFERNPIETSPFSRLQQLTPNTMVQNSTWIAEFKNLGFQKFLKFDAIEEKALCKAWEWRRRFFEAYMKTFFDDDEETYDISSIIWDELAFKLPSAVDEKKLTSNSAIEYMKKLLTNKKGSPNEELLEKVSNFVENKEDGDEDEQSSESEDDEDEEEIIIEKFSKIKKRSIAPERPNRVLDHLAAKTSTSIDIQKTSTSQNASKVMKDGIQKTTPLKKLPEIDVNQSKNCKKCLRTSEMCNEAKKELKMTQNKLEKLEKRTKKAGEVEKELKALKLGTKKKEKEAESRESELEKEKKENEELKMKVSRLEANETRMHLAEKNHSISQNELLEKITELSGQLKKEKEKNELLQSEKIDELTAQVKSQKERMELQFLQNEERLNSEIRQKERGFQELRAALSIMSNEKESFQRENRNLRERIASILEAPPTPTVPESLSDGHPTHHRFALLGFQKIKDSLYHKKQLKKAKYMIQKLKSSTDLVEIHQIADYEYYQFEGKLLKYTKGVELNIQRIQETCDVSTVTPLPDSPEFSQRFMNLYWRIINNQSITPSEIEVSDSECFICYVEMTSDQKTLQCEECKKVTHFECASKWLKIHRSCPHCRREMLDPEEFPNLGQ
ncbi:Protein CBG12418 [Caenorhabditis briggsae]|uniref:Protein CBG12418 n=1 Tax=Caenorhabditis briggsae TaxID=6238 RepID=A8XFE0_CAEBR|nr:Protein CBG12418 [Caenorhabditis briggsae]CAP31401.2 Protein CBG12418 [Caenorhabditis briggsae]